MEKNINLTQQSYVDYVASLYLAACNVRDITFTPKVIETKGGETLILIHVSGVQTTSGVKVNFDLFPRDNATEEDIKNFPKSLSDIEFRIGYWPKVNENGDTVLAPGTPKWTVAKTGDTKTVLSGGKREYQA